MSVRPAGVVAVLTMVAVVAASAACSDTTGETSPFATPAPGPTTTVASLDGTLENPGDQVAAPAGESPSVIRDRLRQAVEDEDTCDLLEAFDLAPDVTDPAAVVAVYGDLATAAADAQAFVPDVLTTEWDAVVVATDNAAAVTRRSGGDIEDPALRAAFETAEFNSAMAAIDGWSAVECS